MCIRDRNSLGKDVVSMEVGKKNSGTIILGGRSGITSLKLESVPNEGGRMTCFNLRGSETVYMGTNKINGGQIKMYNGLGLETVFLGTDQNDAGLLSVNNNAGLFRAMVGVGRGDKGILNAPSR